MSEVAEGVRPPPLGAQLACSASVSLLGQKIAIQKKRDQPDDKRIDACRAPPHFPAQLVSAANVTQRKTFAKRHSDEKSHVQLVILAFIKIIVADKPGAKAREEKGESPA